MKPIAEWVSLWYLIVASRTCAPVAQLDRASDFESVGRGFESLRARQDTIANDALLRYSRQLTMS